MINGMFNPSPDCYTGIQSFSPSIIIENSNSFLSRYSHRCITFHQLQNFINGNQVEIAIDSMFQE